eukprot:scaffold497_cov135-Skeletonema_marinoi.AAC.3
MPSAPSWHSGGGGGGGGSGDGSTVGAVADMVQPASSRLSSDTQRHPLLTSIVPTYHHFFNPTNLRKCFPQKRDL